MQDTQSHRGNGWLGSRAWNSPTITTWASLAARALSLGAVLPLILTRLTAAEIAVWYVFATMVGLRVLIDMGFATTFIRVIAYAMGGATDLHDFRKPVTNTKAVEANWGAVAAIVSTMRYVYVRLTTLLVIAFGTLGTLALVRPMSLVDDRTSAWLAWTALVLITTVSFYGSVYRTYLQGLNQIPLFRRWETVAWLGAAISSGLVLFGGGGLFALVIANQGWSVISVLWNRHLSRRVEEGRFRHMPPARTLPDVLSAVWPSAWRSGLGVFMAAGLIQLSGIVYAQLGDVETVAAYLLALNLMYNVSLFSQAPFYSKIPTLARLRSQGRLDEQVQLAKRGMRLSYWGFVCGILAAGILMPLVVDLVNSNVPFVEPWFWALFGVAFFAERYGAMHIQLYSITNHIIWHIANGISGIIFVAATLVLFPLLHLAAFPLSILTGYLGFYCWYAAVHSYRAFQLRFVAFEQSTSALPLAVLLLYALTTGLWASL